MPKVFLFFIAFITLFQACKQQNVCLLPQSVSLRGGFYKKDTSDAMKDSLLVNANLFVFGKDSAYGLNLKKFSKFSFTPATTFDSTRFFYQSDSTTLNPNTIDTVVVFYNRQLKFVSVACGFQNEFSLQQIKYTQHVIDSAFIFEAEVNVSANKEHIKIVLQD